jgi:hypothetical protein
MHFEPLWRGLHLFWRLSRGQILDVRVLAFDAAGAVFLVEPVPGAGWQLPRGSVAPGQTARQAAHGVLAAAGLGLPAGGLGLHRLYRGAGESGADQVALYVTRGATRAGTDGSDAARGFFAPSALPPGADAATRRRIAEVLAGGPADAGW